MNADFDAKAIFTYGTVYSQTNKNIYAAFNTRVSGGVRINYIVVLNNE